LQHHPAFISVEKIVVSAGASVRSNNLFVGSALITHAMKATGSWNLGESDEFDKVLATLVIMRYEPLKFLL
tara:strand:- start:3341 stop:3553 length:213 start_codon:yes stop_codon:yes gene_type:complete